MFLFKELQQDKFEDQILFTYINKKNLFSILGSK